MTRSLLNGVIIFFFLVTCFCSVGNAQDHQSDTADEIETMTLEIEDTINGNRDDKFDDLEGLMVTKELEGEIREVGDDYLVAMIEEGQELELLVDAETLIYINDEKSELNAVQPGDEIFAYYIEENGSLKCDWIEITR